MPDSLVPLRDALDDHGFGKKGWGKLLEAGLMVPAERAGDEMRYCITSAQDERLRTIGTMRDRLGTHYTFSAVAFEFACDGDRTVPIGLVKDYIRLRVTRTQGQIRRAFQRHLNLSSDLSRVSEHDIATAATKFAKGLTRNAPGKSRVYDFLLFYAAAVFRMMYAAEVPDYSDDISALMTPFVRVNHRVLGPVGMPLTQIRENASKLAMMLAGVRDNFRLDEDNAMLVALERIPDDVFWKLFDVWPAICTIVWKAGKELTGIIPIPKPSPSGREAFNLILLAALIANYDHAHPPVAYRELLRGKVTGFESSVEKLVKVVKMAVQIQRLVRLALSK